MHGIVSNRREKSNVARVMCNMQSDVIFKETNLL